MFSINKEVLEVFNEDVENKKSMIYRKWEREKKRIERGNYHYEQMLNRYDEECGECIVVSPAKGV